MNLHQILMISTIHEVLGIICRTRIGINKNCLVYRINS